MVLQNKDSFLYWLFEKRDVDGLVIALLISNSIGMFTKDLSTAIVEPIISAFLPTNDNDQQILNFQDTIIIKFKLQYLFSGLLKVAVNLYVAYVIVTLVYKNILKV
jgi:hypothetical protein